MSVCQPRMPVSINLNENSKDYNRLFLVLKTNRL